MKIFLLLSFAFTAALAAPQEVSTFIAGGVNALPGEFPFMVSIQHCFLGCDHICGGSVLNTVWILTAAHCFTETSTRGSIDAFLGRHNLNLNEASGVRLQIDHQRWIIHPAWISGRNFGPNDIALGRLFAPITFNAHIRPIRLPQQGAAPSGPGTLAGWGATFSGIGSGPVNVLQKVLFSTITQEVCHEAVMEFDRDSELIDNTKFCTGPLTGGKLIPRILL